MNRYAPRDEMNWIIGRRYPERKKTTAGSKNPTGDFGVGSGHLFQMDIVEPFFLFFLVFYFRPANGFMGDYYLGGFSQKKNNNNNWRSLKMAWIMRRWSCPIIILGHLLFHLYVLMLNGLHWYPWSVFWVNIA